MPGLWANQDNRKTLSNYHRGEIIPNPNYTPYPPSRNFMSNDPRYWGGVDNAFMQGYGDKHALYVNASSDNTSEAGDRFAQGMASANSLISQLDAGKVTLADGETIKIVGHSQGGAFAAGIASVLSKNEKYKSILQEVVYLEPHQPAAFSHPSSVSGTQISSPDDRVASIWNFLSPVKGKTSFSWVNGVQNKKENKTHAGDYLGGHSIGTNLDEIAEYFQSKGVKVTVKE